MPGLLRPISPALSAVFCRAAVTATAAGRPGKSRFPSVTPLFYRNTRVRAIVTVGGRPHTITPHLDLKLSRTRYRYTASVHPAQSTMGDAKSLGSRPISECIADHLEQPSLDDRTYRVIRLSNKLEALLIHDPDTDKASAALDNNAGGFSDDDDLPGMAHAVEHLLFMGTKKYPKENEYNRYLTAHSGYSNAFTASTSTNYFFEIAVTPEEGDKASQQNNADSNTAAPLYGALDRFAQFFIDPLFLEETLDRELRAVDSENKKNLQNDGWRLNQLGKSLTNPQHPYNGFSTGNLKTLRDDPLARGVKIRDEFMRFHKEQYSANRMKLVVLGRESLDQLQSWVEELFSPIENKNLPENRWDGIPLIGPKQERMQIFAKPVMDTRYLELMFPYQDEDPMYDTQPGHYLSHLIGHEGPGSILAYTKAKGWVDSLNAGSSHICPGSGKFTVTMSLTPEGLKHYEELAKIVFQYISILRETDPQKWIFDEVKVLAEIAFKFKQKSPASRTTSALSQTMQEPVPRDRLLSGYSWPRTFDAAAIKHGLSYLRADHVQMTLVSSQDLPGEVKREKWYGTEYSVQPIRQELLDALREAESVGPGSRLTDLRLPYKNEFIPSNLHVERKEVKEPAKAPKLIRNDATVRLWYKKDDQFWVPKANVFLILRNTITGASPHTVVLGLLIGYMIEDALTEYAYDAELASLVYSISGTYTGVSMSVTGYNDKLPVLLEKLLVTLKEIDLKEDRFGIIKERLIRAYKNSELGTPYYQVGQFTRWLSTERSYTYKQLLAELEGVTLEDVRHFHPLLLQRFHIEALVQGNVYREDALRYADMVERILKPSPFPEQQWPIRRSFILPPGSSYVYEQPLEDPLNVNHCIEYVVSLGSKEDLNLRARALLFAQMTEEPAFDQLRTKEQLGYVVFSGFSTNLTRIVYHVLIQSERPPSYLEKRIDRFLANFKLELANMSDEQFDSHKRSLINKRLEKVKNLGQEANRFWDFIGTEYYNFDSVDVDVANIRPLRKQDLIEFYNFHIDPSSKSRAKLSVHLTAKASPEDAAADMSADERNRGLVDLASKLLTDSGLTPNPEKIQARLEAVNAASAGQEAILSALQQYCKEDAGLGPDEANKIRDNAQAAMPQFLPQLGIQSKPADSGEAAVPTLPATKIEDVHAWKASLDMSKGARPVKDLSEYEDLESKL